MSMRIYVAGASNEAVACATDIQRCRDMGFDCTRDWTRSVLAHRANGESDEQLSQAERSGYAAGDLDGVRSCDIFWFRVPKGGSLGAWIELGAAIVLGKHILVSEDHGRSIFTALAHVHRPTHEGALAYLGERIGSIRR